MITFPFFENWHMFDNYMAVVYWCFGQHFSTFHSRKSFYSITVSRGGWAEYVYSLLTLPRFCLSCKQMILEKIILRILKISLILCCFFFSLTSDLMFASLYFGLFHSHSVYTLMHNKRCPHLEHSLIRSCLTILFNVCKHLYFTPGTIFDFTLSMHSDEYLHSMPSIPPLSP